MVGVVIVEMVGVLECVCCGGRKVVLDVVIVGVVCCVDCGGSGFELFSGCKWVNVIGVDCLVYSCFW